MGPRTKSFLCRFFTTGPRNFVITLVSPLSPTINRIPGTTVSHRRTPGNHLRPGGYRISSKFSGVSLADLARAWGQTLNSIESSCIRPVHGIETPVDLHRVCAGVLRINRSSRARFPTEGAGTTRRSRFSVRPLATHFGYQRVPPFVMINGAHPCAHWISNTVTDATLRGCHVP
jgi:hypothetical protein